LSELINLLAQSPTKPKQSYQDCLNGFNKSLGGAAVNFLSLTSPFIGPDPLQSALEDVGGTALKFGVHQGLQATSNSYLSIGGSTAEFLTGAGAGLAADIIEIAAKDVVLPLAVGATAIQIGAHALCYASSP
jgi:hypothetical protein